MIHIIPELATYPSLEEEFVKATQELLGQGIFQQMVDSKKDTSCWKFVDLNTQKKKKKKKKKKETPFSLCQAQLIIQT